MTAKFFQVLKKERFYIILRTILAFINFAIGKCTVSLLISDVAGAIVTATVAHCHYNSKKQRRVCILMALVWWFGASLNVFATEAGMIYAMIDLISMFFYGFLLLIVNKMLMPA